MNKKWFFIFASIGLLFFSSKSEAVRISFVGDIMTHQQQLQIAKIKDGYDFIPQFESILPYLSADLLIGNFETTLPGNGSYTGYPSFGTPDTLADALVYSGFNVLLLANNHMYDKGKNGLIRTIDILGQKGFSTTGAYRNKEESKPLLLNMQGIDIGILNYTYGSNYPLNSKLQGNTHMNIIDENAIQSDIKKLIDSGAKFVIATFHWGNEYQPKPSGNQRKIARMCLDAGANMVVGTHPHILQPIEVYGQGENTKVTAFSLGNFVSNQRPVPRERSVILSVEINNNSGKIVIKKIEVAPTYVETGNDKNGRYLRVIHASNKKNIEKEILHFLNINSIIDNNGFYQLYKN